MASRFEVLLKEGQATEMLVASLMLEAGHAARVRNHGMSRDLEVTVGNLTFWVEVKNEDRYADSGNLCIEMKQGLSGKPSGISTSEAQVWIHTLGQQAALYRVQPMRLFIKSSGMLPAPFKGADNRNEGVLVPIASLAVFPWFEQCELVAVGHSRVWSFSELK